MACCTKLLDAQTTDLATTPVSLPVLSGGMATLVYTGNPGTAVCAVEISHVAVPVAGDWAPLKDVHGNDIVFDPSDVPVMANFSARGAAIRAVLTGSNSATSVTLSVM